MIEVLLTGANGFIGKSLAKQLLNNGISYLPLTRKDGDIIKQKTWQHLLPVKHVFHLANRNYVPESWNDKAGFIQSNVIGTQHAIDYCLKHGAKLTYVSAYLYGIPSDLPVKEDCDIQPNNPYALSKHLAEELCCFNSKYLGLNVTIVRPFNVFGPGQRSEYLIPEILRGIDSNKEIRLHDLNPKRDYIYVDDVVAALIKTLSYKNDTKYDVFNIGSGISYSVKEVVDMIQTITNTNLPLISKKIERQHEIPDVYADITRARKILQWSPKYTFCEGIKKII